MAKIQDETKWNLKAVKHLLVRRMIDAERRYEDQLQTLRNDLQRERETTDDKFHAANRYKETFADQLNRLSTDSLKRQELDTRFSAMQDKIDLLSRTNWPLYSSFGGIAITLLAGLWVVIGLQIQATTQPLIVAMEQAKLNHATTERSLADMRTDFDRQTKDISGLLQAAEASKVDRQQLNDRVRLAENQVAGSSQADANSKTDRQQLNTRVTKVEETLATSNAERKASEASFRASLSEIEGQICSGDNIRNLMHATDLRTVATMWNKLGLGQLPTDNVFYPQVCNKGLYPIMNNK